MTEEILQEFAYWLADWPETASRRWVEEHMPTPLDVDRVLGRLELAA